MVLLIVRINSYVHEYSLQTIDRLNTRLTVAGRLKLYVCLCATCMNRYRGRRVRALSVFPAKLLLCVIELGPLCKWKRRKLPAVSSGFYDANVKKNLNVCTLHTCVWVRLWNSTFIFSIVSPALNTGLCINIAFTCVVALYSFFGCFSNRYLGYITIT